ncbi:MAG: hypothetical protein L0177_06250 [Chloroflexi bacterium]|nr:hypothetical protein [Chloroflexota bacterium]
MTTSAEAMIVVSARDNASRVLGQFGGRVERVGQQIQSVQTKISRVTSFLSAFGVGALVGVGSLDALVRKVVENQKASEDFARAQRGAAIVLSQSGVTADQLSETFKIMERTLGRMAATSILQNTEALKQWNRASLDTVVAASQGADMLAKMFGKDKEAAFHATIMAMQGDFEQFNKLMGTNIQTSEEFAVFWREKEQEFKDIDFGKPLAERVGQWFGDLFSGRTNLKDEFIKFMSGIFGPGSAVANWFGDIASGFWDAIKAPAVQWWDDLKVSFSEAWNEDAQKFKEMWSEAGEIAGAVKDFFTTSFPQFFVDAGAVVSRFVTQTVPDFFKDLFDSAKGIPGIISGFIVNTWNGFWSSRIMLAIRDFVSDGKTMISDFFTTTIPSTISGAIGTIGDLAKRYLANPFIGAINEIIGAWNRLEFTLPGFTTPWGQTFGKWALGTPDIQPIQMFAHGGVVTRPTLGILGEAGPEMVLPLSRGRGAGAVHVVIDRVVVQLGSRQFEGYVGEIAEARVYNSLESKGMGPGAWRTGV